jgi:PIN domain nuclease of toxin-antitoxin system
VKLLLDTQVLLWAGAFGGPGKAALPRRAAALIRDETNALYFSPASIWEVAIKTQLGRADFQVDPHLLRRALIDNGYVEAPITSEHAAAVADLPPIHKDPFDRILLAQARVEGLALLTADAALVRYGGNLIKV